jgi:hypothetical protein
MSTDQRTLGGCLPLHNSQALAPAQRKLFDQLTTTAVPWAEGAGLRARTEAGQLIGPFNPAPLTPDISSTFFEIQSAEENHTSLSERTRQVVILTVGAVWQATRSTPIAQLVARPDFPSRRSAYLPKAACPTNPPTQRPSPTASPEHGRSGTASTTGSTGRQKPCSAPAASWTSPCSPASITPCANPHHVRNTGTQLNVARCRGMATNTTTDARVLKSIIDDIVTKKLFLTNRMWRKHQD